MNGTIVRVGTNGPDVFAAAAGETLFGVGRGGDDELTGAELADILFGGGEDDTLAGNEGADILDGGEGNDTINTGADDDFVRGGGGDDAIGGMAGSDVVFAGNGDDLVAWNDPTGDRVFGENGDDTLRGGDVAADTISGGEGDDLIRAVANQELPDHASDILFGDGGDDSILGGNADDRIEGGEGDDTMAGFDGADTFVFRAGTVGEDTINDFDVTEDTVELVGFGDDFDPLANLSVAPAGASLRLGDAGDVLFFGRLTQELTADNFVPTA